MLSCLDLKQLLRVRAFFDIYLKHFHFIYAQIVRKLHVIYRRESEDNVITASRLSKNSKGTGVVDFKLLSSKSIKLKWNFKVN